MLFLFLTFNFNNYFALRLYSLDVIHEKYLHRELKTNIANAWIIISD